MARADVTCTDATYYDSDVGDCVACPTGYDANTTAGKTSINECQIACAAGTKLLSGYENIEYLQSSGTQWIDTGYKHTSDNIRGHIKIGTISATTSKFDILGNQQGDANNLPRKGYSVGWNKGFKVWVNSGSGSNLVGPNWAITANGTYEFEYELDSSNRTITYYPDTSKTATGAHPGDIQTDNVNLMLFKAHSIGNTRWTGRIYSFQLYEDNNLVLDLIPVRRKSDGTLGMLDKLTGTFLTNSGTGTFTTNANYTRTDVAACIPVGTGHYNGVTVTNYGSVGTYNDCPAGTYNNTTNATSINDCLPCSGATYNDETAQAACKACPTGYTANTTPGKTAVN